MASTANPASRLLEAAQEGVLLYGVTPPRLTTTSERADEIAGATLARLASVGVDGLLVYDVDVESDRSPDPRPFPFMPMMDPAVFHDRHLTRWPGPVVIYRAVGKYTEGRPAGLAGGGRPRSGAHRAGRSGVASPGRQDTT
jgi:hypothetical protein